MGNYWTNFAKKGDPNGPGLPQWPLYQKAGDYSVMHLGKVGNSDIGRAQPDRQRNQFEVLGSYVSGR